MMDEASEDYTFSNREELAPLVRDFHELIGRDLTDGEVKALDFAMEWTFASAEADYEDKLMSYTDTEFSVTYGTLPNIHMLSVPTLEVAKKVAQGLNGQVRVRSSTKWRVWRPTE
jgi:hypothetical protein